MASSSLSTLCTSIYSSLHHNSKPLHTLSAKLSSKVNVSVQFLGKKQYPVLSSTPRFRTVIAMARPKPGGIAKKVVRLVKLNLEAGKATKTPKTPEAGNATKTKSKTPNLGPALGSKGVNLDAFCKEYNARTADKVGYIIPVEITIFDDRSYTFILKTPPTSFLLLKAAGLQKGSKDPQLTKVGTITKDQLQTIAAEKLPDLNCTTIESAMRIIAGTAANMGIDIDPPVLEPKKKAVLL